MNNNQWIVDYAIHILKCSLWEWEGIKDTMLKSIAKNHPYQEACVAIEAAEEKIPQLKRAIELLQNAADQKYATKE